jgi:hypothetical protein
MTGVRVAHPPRLAAIDGGGEGEAPLTVYRGVRFAHASERQLAELLDFYGVAWEYEPRTFDLEVDCHGQATEAFTPDFYLPLHDLYVEITTLNQKLVTKKNRKVRRVRELYGVEVKLLYQRDYLHLLATYGLDAVVGNASALAAVEVTLVATSTSTAVGAPES